MAQSTRVTMSKVLFPVFFAAFHVWWLHSLWLLAGQGLWFEEPGYPQAFQWSQVLLALEDCPPVAFTILICFRTTSNRLHSHTDELSACFVIRCRVRMHLSLKTLTFIGHPLEKLLSGRWQFSPIPDQCFRTQAYRSLNRTSLLDNSCLIWAAVPDLFSVGEENSTERIVTLRKVCESVGTWRLVGFMKPGPNSFACSLLFATVVGMLFQWRPNPKLSLERDLTRGVERNVWLLSAEPAEGSEFCSFCMLDSYLGAKPLWIHYIHWHWSLFCPTNFTDAREGRNQWRAKRLMGLEAGK